MILHRVVCTFQEHYDDEDRARQLALGTMMLRNHRAKELVDAAYNRFSWNDDTDLPDWFIDDEKRHYRPQVPLPPALLEQMKQKFMSLAAKPIKKVAEARLRKRKRATQRLAAAKKKASALAANPGIFPTYHDEFSVTFFGHFRTSQVILHSRPSDISSTCEWKRILGYANTLPSPSPSGQRWRKFFSFAKTTFWISTLKSKTMLHMLK